MEQEVKDEEKNVEECYCEKKIKILAKEIKQLKIEIDKQKRDLLTLKKALKR